MSEVTDQDILKALDGIARTPDGEVLYAYLQKTLCAVATNDGALPRNEGRRSFAAELMGLMAEGIEASGGRNGRPIVFVRRQPVSVGQRQSIREWLRDNPDADPTAAADPAKPGSS